MNNQNSKKIVFNKSTLFNLKAELLKKQEEVKDKKHLPEHNVQNFRPPAKVSKPDREDSKKKTLKDNLRQIDTDELESYKKTRLALEKKAELYEHLSDSAGNSQLSSTFLVDFNTKKQTEGYVAEPIPEPEPEELPDYEDDDDSEWSEFTDCLGRTRKCLKSDLELYMQQDVKLAKVVFGNKEVVSEDTNNSAKEAASQKPFLVQKTNDYLQSLRAKWEEKEKELLAKDKDIHYQDLLFDEARMHGVGYFAFSTDENERRKQMEDLRKTHEDTLKAQHEAEATRWHEEAALRARAQAARARVRIRAGLPPEDPDDNLEDFNARLLEFLNKQKDEADAKAKEEEKKKKEAAERERQKFREAFVREWDVGKDGVEAKGKKFREMSQEEYVEQQRARRIDEFAPPQASSKHNSHFIRQGTDYLFNDRGKKVETVTSNSVPSKSWADVRPKESTQSLEEHLQISEQKGLYFSSSSPHNSHFIRQGTDYLFNDRGKKVETVTSNSVPCKSWADVRPKESTPSIEEHHQISEQKGLYFSSSSQHNSHFIRQGTDYLFNDRGKKVETVTSNSVPSKSWADVPPKESTPSLEEHHQISEQKGLYFSSSSPHNSHFIRQGTDYLFNDRGKKVETVTSNSVPSKSWADVPPKESTLSLEEHHQISEQKGLYFSSSSPHNSHFIRQGTDYLFNDRGKKVETVTSNSVPSKSWADVPPKESTPYLEEHHQISEQKGLYFPSSSQLQTKPKPLPKYRNFDRCEDQVPAPIVNEVEDVDGGCLQPGKRQYDPFHAEIEPPPTYEYFGPVPKHAKHEKPFTSDMRESYAQGSKSLDTKKNYLQLSKQYDFTFD